MGYLTTKETAEIIGVNESTVRLYLKNGKLHGKLLGEGNRATWLVNPLSIEEFVQSGGRSTRGRKKHQL